MDKSKTTSTFDRMTIHYHNYNPKPKQITSIMVQKINAPLHVVWSIVRCFDQPQVYKKFLRKCTMLTGNGRVGDVREVEVVSGMPCKVSRERLDRLDDDMHVITYTIIEGDHRLVNYRSTTTVHEEEEGGSGGETVMIESYLVDVPAGNSEEETRVFINTVLGCNHRSLANVSEKVAARTC